MSEVTGKITGVYVGKQNGGGKTEVSAAELIADYGLCGDSHAGRESKRQVSLFAQETLNQLSAEGFTIAASALSANLFTENIKLNSLKPGTQIRVGETLLEIVEVRKPCRSITRIDSRLPKRLYGQCGQLACILKGGIIQVGDGVEIVANQRQMSLGF
jgi:MOSC domain-containing protein YiiM